ncbi:hypothetical protein B0H19DRAFT_1375644 [Mycena capillaripes]|nr:hypothetical protein B0H19DRAFT_1375644 [Mycena capillaripes]
MRVTSSFNFVFWSLVGLQLVQLRYYASVMHTEAPSTFVNGGTQNCLEELCVTRQSTGENLVRKLVGMLFVDVASTGDGTGQALELRLRREQGVMSTATTHPSVYSRARARCRLVELTTLIDALASERKHFEAELDSFVYPVLDLPPEITARIFVLSLPTDSQPSPSSAPLLLAHICREWRVLALASPRLWQTITFDYGIYEHNSCERLLDMWLHHSRNLPLILSFTCKDDTQRLVNASLIHCHRWQEITLGGNVSLNVPRSHFPILRKVTLGRDISGTIVIQNAPVLEEASTRIVPNSYYYDVRLPWAQLTTLTILTFGPLLGPAVESMLHHCSENLLHLIHRVGVDHWNRGAAFNHPHMTLKSLESLNVHCGSDILPHLTLPRIRRLTLDCRFHGCRFHGSIGRIQVQALLSRSSSSLHYLSIIFDEKERPNLTEIQLLLQSVPTVADLTLVLPHVELPKVVELLFCTLPLMETLAIDAVPVWDSYDSLLTLLRTLRSQASGPPSLKSFDLILRPHAHPDAFTGPIPEISMAQFRELAMGGLKIRIQFENSILLDIF